MKSIFAGIASLVHRRPGSVLAVGVIITLVLAIGLTQIHLNTGYDTFVNGSSTTYQDYRAFQRAFGGDGVYVMTTGSRSGVLSQAGLAAQRAAAADLLRNSHVQEVVSPATVIDLEVQETAAKVATLQKARAHAEQLAIAQARKATSARPAKVVTAAVAQAKQKADAAFLAHLRSSSPQAAALLSLGPITPANPKLLAFIVYPDGKTMNAVLASFFPDATHSITQVQLKGNIDVPAQQNANDAIRKAYNDDHRIPGQTITIAGIPVLLGDLQSVELRQAFMLFGLAFLIMAVVLLVVFTVRWRLLPLGVVVAAIIVCFGFVGWVRLDLSMATVATLPILLGLGVDYAVQFQNRYEEEAGRGKGFNVALQALAHIGPAVGIAVITTILGFLTLLISPVPSVRDFGKVLAFGVAIAYLAGAFALTAIVVLRDRRGAIHARAARNGDHHFVDRVLGWLSDTLIPRPLPVLLAAVLLTLVGWTADAHIGTQSDMEKLAPQNMAALKALQAIRVVNGGTSEVDVMINAPDVTAPAVMTWMKSFETQALARHKELISADSPVTLLQAAAGTSNLSAAQARALLLQTPAVLRDPVFTSDARHANIAFLVKYMPLDHVVTLIDQLRAEAHPPANVQAVPTGTEVLGARALTVLTDNRLQMTLLGVGAVFAGLLLLYRGIRRPLFVVVPMILVIGWSEGAMYVLNQPWNPLTVTMGALIIGIGAEFTILLTERYFEERRAGQNPAAAMGMAMRRIGRAILTSGLMVLAGFSALTMSDFPALRSFGIVVAVDMAAILLATLVVLPPLVVWLESRWPQDPGDTAPAQ